MHLLTHLSKSVLDWGCLWATSAFIPEWFNGQLQSLSNGTQSVIDQMARTFLFRNCVRNEVISLLKEDHVSPKVASLLRKMICLPNNYGFLNSKSKIVEGDVNVKLLGKPNQKFLTPTEEEALKIKLLTCERDKCKREHIKKL